MMRRAFDLTFRAPMSVSLSFAASFDHSEPGYSDGLPPMTFDQEVEALAREVFSESRYEWLRSKWTGMTNPLVGDSRERQLALDAEAFFSDERFETFDRIWKDQKMVNPLVGKSINQQLI